jgi:D-threo-aldose 1-dehydrogenase
MRDKRITSTVVGVGKPDRVAETLEWANLAIADSVWEELAAIPYSIENPQEGLI